MWLYPRIFGRVDDFFMFTNILFILPIPCELQSIHYRIPHSPTRKPTNKKFFNILQVSCWGRDSSAIRLLGELVDPGMDPTGIGSKYNTKSTPKRYTESTKVTLHGSKPDFKILVGWLVHSELSSDQFAIWRFEAAYFGCCRRIGLRHCPTFFRSCLCSKNSSISLGSSHYTTLKIDPSNGLKWIQFHQIQKVQKVWSSIWIPSPFFFFRGEF